MIITIGSLTVFLLIGLIYGAVLSVLYFQINKRILGTFMTLIVTTGGFYAVKEILKSGLEQETNIPFIFCVLVYLIGNILGFIIILRLQMRYLRKIEPSAYNLYAGDVLLGDSSFKEVRKKMADKKLQRDELAFERRDLQMIREQIDYENRKLEKERNNLRENEEKLKQQISEGVFYTLPKNNNQIPITNDIINKQPLFIKKLINFSHELIEFTNLVMDDVDKKDDNLKVYDGYFQAICTYATKHLFDIDTARIHFRYLHDNKSFKKLVTSVDRDDNNYSLSEINCDNSSLILSSFNSKRSLIKSINIDDHYPTGSEEIWKDYITFALYEFKTANDIPLISLGISVKDEGECREMLYFLNQIRFGEFIQNYVKKINEKVSLEEYIISLN